MPVAVDATKQKQEKKKKKMAEKYEELDVQTAFKKNFVQKNVPLSHPPHRF